MGPVLGPHARTDRTRGTRVAEPWLPAREDGRPGEGQRLTPGTPHSGGRPPPPLGTAPHNPRGMQPQQGMQAKGTVLGSHTHTPATTERGWRTPTARPSWRAVGGGRAPGLRRSSQCWKAPPPGTPLRHPVSEQRRPARAHTVGPVLGPHARTDRTRDTRVAEPWLPAPEDGQPGEGQRLTPGAPHIGGRHPPRGRPSATPTASIAGRQGRTLWNRCWVPTPAPTAPGTHGSRNPGCPLQRGGTAPDSRRRSQRWQATPPGTAPQQPPRHTVPTGHAGQGDSVGPPHPHTCAHSTWVADPNSPLSRRAVGGGTAPDLRRPSQWWKAPSPGTPFRHPHSEQRRPARAHAVGPMLGPHACIDRSRDTRVAEPWPPASKDGRPGEGQRLTPGAPRNGGRPAPRGQPPTTPVARSPDRACRPEGQCWATTSTHPRPQHVGGGPQQPAQWAGSQGRDSA